MVLQITPHTRAVQDGFDAERRQPVSRSDPGAVQHLHRSDRAGAENDLASGAGLDHLATLDKTHAGGAAALYNQAIDQPVFLKAQVWTPRDGFQKSARR